MAQPTLGVMLYVRDLKRSVAFYRDVMGFEFQGWWDDVNAKVVDDYDDLAQPPGYAEVRVGEQSLGLHPAESITVGEVVVHLVVDDIRAFHATVQAAGAEPSEPQLMPWGEWMFTVKDPDGHAWGICQPAHE